VVKQQLLFMLQCQMSETTSRLGTANPPLDNRPSQARSPMCSSVYWSSPVPIPASTMTVPSDGVTGVPITVSSKGQRLRSSDVKNLKRTSDASLVRTSITYGWWLARVVRLRPLHAIGAV